jgi:hypothetical protein
VPLYLTSAGTAVEDSVVCDWLNVETAKNPRTRSGFQHDLLTDSES